MQQDKIIIDLFFLTIHIIRYKNIQILGCPIHHHPQFSLTSMIKISGTVDDEEIKRALDKTRETSGDFNLARAIDILLGKCREAAFL